MPAAGAKRKTRAKSPQQKKRTRRSQDEEEPIFLTSRDSDGDAEDEDGDGDHDEGRAASEEMLGEGPVQKRPEKQEGKWAVDTKASIDKNLQSLMKEIDDQESCWYQQNDKFKSSLRNVLASVLGTPKDCPKAKPDRKHRRFITDETENETETEIDPRPGYAHFNMLIGKANSLLGLFDKASAAVLNMPTFDDNCKLYETDAQQVEKLLAAGREATRRRMELVLQPPALGSATNQAAVGTKNSTAFGKDVRDADAIWDSLKDEDRKQPDVTDIVTACKPGLFPLLRDVDRGVKRMFAHMPATPDMHGN